MGRAFQAERTDSVGKGPGAGRAGVCEDGSRTKGCQLWGEKWGM